MQSRSLMVSRIVRGTLTTVLVMAAASVFDASNPRAAQAPASDGRVADALR
jgi:hypothetical protein